MSCSNIIQSIGNHNCGQTLNQRVSYQLNLNDFDKITRKHLRLLIKQYEIYSLDVMDNDFKIVYFNLTNPEVKFKLNFKRK